TLAKGSYLTATDVATRRRVAVLGSAVAQKLFADREPLGRFVAIAGVRFRVIGVFKKQGSTFGVSPDDEVHVPVTAAQRLFGVDRIDALAVKAPSTKGISTLQHKLAAALQNEYPGQ